MREAPMPGTRMTTTCTEEGGLSRSPMSQYAVISVRTGPHCEQVVIGYSDEKSLRDLLAAPSILGLGYRSTKEAKANIDCFTTTACSSRRRVTATSDTTARSPKRLLADRELPRGEFILARTRRTISDLVQYSFAMAIAVLYSENVLSAAARALISL